MKKPWNEQRYAIDYKLIFDCLDFSGYEIDPKTDAEKIQALHDTFMCEKGSWHIPQVGQLHALVDWLQGIPSALTLPFYNSDILEWAVKNGKLPENATEKRQDSFLEKYWQHMAIRILGLFRYFDVK